MRFRSIFLKSVSHVLVMAGLCSSSFGASAGGMGGLSYRIQDLGTLGGASSYAYDINDSGVVVGGAQTLGQPRIHAFRYSIETGMEDLGTFGYQESVAYRVNAYGRIAGWLDGTGPAFVMDGPGNHRLLWEPSEDSQARAINSAGQVVGFTSALSSPFTYRAFTASADGVSIILPATSGLSFSAAYAINDAGLIGGAAREYDSAAGPARAFLYSPDHGLDFVGPADAAYSVITSLNQLGYGTMAATRPGAQDYRSYIVSPNGEFLDIGCNNCVAQRINDSNAVVGRSGDHGAFLYTHSTGLIYLQSLLTGPQAWQLSEATAINNSGQIVGIGTIDGETHGFLLSPVPEVTKASMILLIRNLPQQAHALSQ